MLHNVSWGRQGGGRLDRHGMLRSDQRGFWGCTSLAWDAWGGHEKTAKVLLALEEASAHKPNIGGRTPLSYAAERERVRAAGHDLITTFFWSGGGLSCH